MDIDLTFLGTGSAIPTLKRNHSSIFLKYKGENLLFDCGEGTQRQLKKARINFMKLTKIFITHWHGDHVLGLPGLFQSLALSDYDKVLHIYGPKGTSKFVKELTKCFVSVNKIRVVAHEVSKKVFSCPDFFIESYSLNHSANCVGYRFVERDKLRINKDKLSKFKFSKSDEKKIKNLCLGKDIRVNNKLVKSKDVTYLQVGKKIGFVFDSKVCDNAFKIAKGCDLLVCESSYSDSEEDLAKEYRHLTSRDAASIAKRSGAKKLFLTHIGQRFDNKEGVLLSQARSVFKNSFVAKDLLKVVV